jgi:hydroxymethylbilane synthase
MSPITSRTIILGSRPSRLARWQSETILHQLQAAWPGLPCRMITIQTQGDRTLDRPLPEIGGKGLFTSELESALRSAEIDLAVHSLKDIPVDDSPGLCIAAISQRADACDVLISVSGKSLNALPPGARVGTSSLRRAAQVLAARPDLTILSLRGNVDTRIHKILQGEYDAIILAAAGVERLGLEKYVTEHLPYEVMLPAPGQGALAIQCRANDESLHELLAPLHDLDAARAVSAERAFLASLGGGCSAPIAAYAQSSGSHLSMTGLVASPDGKHIVRVMGEGEEPLDLGTRLARQALELGAGALLA